MKTIKYLITIFLIFLIGCGAPKMKNSEELREIKDTISYHEYVMEEAVEEGVFEEAVEEGLVEEAMEEMSEEDELVEELVEEGIIGQEEQDILEDLQNQFDTTQLVGSPQQVKTGKPSMIKKMLQRKPASSEPVASEMEEDTYSGTLFYKIDSIFTIDVTTRVEAKIIQKIFEDVSETEYIIEMFHETPYGKVKTETIQVSNVMDMELISLQHNAFMISKISSSNQIVNNESVTEWMWGVTPMKEGNFNLILKAVIKDGDGQKDKIVFDKNIDVKNRPKTKFNVKLEIPSNLKRYNNYIIKLGLRENKLGEDYDFEWNGYGDLELDFYDKVKITDIDKDYSISDDRTLYNFEWKIQPLYKDTLNYELRLIGYNDEIVIANNSIFVDKNLKETIIVYVNKVKDKWYWLFTTLIIPLFNFIKKKYFTKNKKTEEEEIEDELEELKEEIEELKEDINGKNN